jgi:membrane-associated phospholipid phosphatase
MNNSAVVASLVPSLEPAHANLIQTMRIVASGQPARGFVYPAFACCSRSSRIFVRTWIDSRRHAIVSTQRLFHRSCRGHAGPVHKFLVRRRRPDRTIRGRRNGIPYSGDAWDSFPSGHAIHLGAMAPSAARLVPKSLRQLLWPTVFLPSVHQDFSFGTLSI